MRNPRRTAATASALVIGLALVAMVAILGDSAKAQVDAADSALDAELVIDTTQFTGFSPDVVARMERSPRSRARSGSGSAPYGSTGPTGASASGSWGQRARARRRLRPADAERSVAELGGDGMLVPTKRRPLRPDPGDRVPLEFPNGVRGVRVAGVYAGDDVVGGAPFFVSRELFVAGFPEADLDYRAYANVAPGTSVTAAPRGSPTSCAPTSPTSRSSPRPRRATPRPS